MKYLITGGTGFLGEVLVKELVKNTRNELYVISRNPIDIPNINNINADLLRKEDIIGIFDKFQFDILVHLAWVKNPGVNLNSEENLLWLERSKELITLFYEQGGKKLICAGSCFEYDFNYEICDEYETPLMGDSLYSNSKITLMKFVDQYCKENDKSYIWTRLFNMYGPGEYKQRLVPSIIDSLKTNKVAVCNNSSTIKDYIYVEDAAKAIDNLLNKDAMGVFNICSGQGIVLKDFCEEIRMIINPNGQVNYLQNSCQKQIGKNTRMQAYYKPTISIHEGLKKIIES